MTERDRKPAANTWRKLCHFAIVWMIVISQFVSRAQTASAAPKEFCRWETFNATCPAEGGVVLMRSAEYGRMRQSRCLETDFYVGCWKDVLLWVDELCSGRKQCSIDVPNPRLHEIQPCPKDFQTYLEADYECVTGQSTVNGCQDSPIQVSQPTEVGYLSSLITDLTSQGSATCPWIIHVERGQKINVTLYDFSVISNEMLDESRCHPYATIKERDSRPEKVCGGNQRIKKIYTSVSNEIRITIVKQTAEKDRRSFLIKYQAVGCPDVTVSDASWTERSGDHLTIGCNCTDQAWHLVCKDTQWIGDFGQCQPCPDFQRNPAIYPYGLLFSIIIGVILGIFIGICLLGVLLACRRRRSSSEEPTHYYVERSELEKQMSQVRAGGGGGGGIGGPAPSAASAAGYAGFINPGHPGDVCSIGTSSYAHIRDSQMPPACGGRYDRDVNAKTLKLVHPLRPAAAAGGLGLCCESGSGRSALTIGRLYDCPVTDSGHLSKASTVLYEDDIGLPIYNDVAAPD